VTGNDALISTKEISTNKVTTDLSKNKPETSNEDFSEDFNSEDSNKHLEEKERKKVPPKKETELVLKEEKVWDQDVLNCTDAIINLFKPHLRPKTASAEENWIDTVDKLKRIDHVPLKRVYEITKSVLEDDFWKGVVFSVTKLRTKNKEKIPYIVVFNEKFPNGQNKQDAKIEAQKAAYLANSNPNDLM
jgi:hypothetical protein